ncbi:hypothetical protein MAE02_08540 [Microvirga aerophila]|uniref:Uncharacterized protein n=1 Tax=Microvirga aerophila TaxID=670291 RepID=A0A512BMH7_9HYPH|nr:hypothetical protein MAE02_08540 [Microvirga aerophila]
MDWLIHREAKSHGTMSGVENLNTFDVAEWNGVRQLKVPKLFCIEPNMIAIMEQALKRDESGFAANQEKGQADYEEKQSFYEFERDFIEYQCIAD